MARAAAPAPARLTSPPRDGNGLAQPAQGALNALIDVIAELLLQVRSSPAQPNCSTSPACTNCATGPSTNSTEPKPSDRTGCDRRPRRASGGYAKLTDSERIVGNLHRAFAELDGRDCGCPLDEAQCFADMVAFNGGAPLRCLA
jgi:hypothetical protein